MSTPDPSQPNPNIQPPSAPPSFGDPPAQPRVGEPQGPNAPQGPGGPGQPSPSTGGDKPKKLGMGAVVGIAAACLVVAGAGGYYFGNSSGQSSGEKTGYAQGEEAGKKAGIALYASGTPGFKKIYYGGYNTGKKVGLEQGRKSGKKTGEKAGKQAGLKEGEQIGYETGRKAGEEAATSTIDNGYSNWLVNQPYIMTVQSTGKSATPYAIAQRHQMQAEYYYSICNASSTQICRHTEKDILGN